MYHRGCWVGLGWGNTSPGRRPPTVRAAFPARLNSEQCTWVSGHKACRAADRPQTLRWRLWKSGQLCNSGRSKVRDFVPTELDHTPSTSKAELCSGEAIEQQSIMPSFEWYRAPRGRCRTVRAQCVHGARTVQCFWDGCPTCTPLNGPHRNTPRVLIFAPCSPYWHTRILQFSV